MARHIDLPRTEAGWQHLNLLVSQGIMGYDSKTGRIIPPEEMQAIAAAKRAQQSNKDPHIMAPLFAAIRELRKFQNTRKKVVCVFPEPIPASQVVAIQMAAISTKSAVPCRRRHSLHGNRGNTSGMQLRFPLV